MKILITGSNKIVSFGEFAYPSSKDQSIFDTLDDDTTVKMMVALATDNGIKITAKKKADIMVQLNDHLVEKYNEVTKMSDTQVFEEIVSNGFAEELKDGIIQRKLFDAGMDFNDLKKNFNSIVSKLGLRLSAKERVAKASEFLEGYLPDADDVEMHLGKISALQDFLGVSSTQAGASMRKWAKDNDITLPKVKAKSKSKLEPGFRGNVKIVADWAIENPSATLEELAKYASENVPVTKTGKDNSAGHALTVFNALIFAKAIYAPVVDEAEVELEEAA